MASKNEEAVAGKSKFQTIGLCLAGLFYLVSTIMVIYNHTRTRGIDTSVKTITFAHWNLEDGFREGFDEAIRLFEELKAKEGKKVKVVQTAVPFRGYRQWFLTQLIGGKPADVIKYSCGSNLLNQYFMPLSEYISKPNPFNKGTVMAGVPWNDTYVDGMRNSMNSVYSEYFGIGTYFHTYRMFVNLDLLEKATGSREMPKNFVEWMEACRKIREYGKKQGIATIPIGVRGFDKATLGKLYQFYLSQINGHLNDLYTSSGSPFADQYEILAAMKKDPEVKKRLLTAVDIVAEIGKYFGEGFTATDLEQTKFLFFSGNVGFFPEGTWNGYSMIKNSPFEVGVMPLPSIDKGHKYSKYFTGALSEQGVRVGGAFGIPKSTPHFDLALEFLQFITSYEINQLVMNYCKWPPAVKQAKFDGIMKKFQPIMDGDHLGVQPPFALGKRSRTKMLEILETVIIEQAPEPGKNFWKEFLNMKHLIEEEAQLGLVGYQRNFLDLEARRTNLGIQSLRINLSAQEQASNEFKQKLAMENYIMAKSNQYKTELFLKELKELK